MTFFFSLLSGCGYRHETHENYSGNECLLGATLSHHNTTEMQALSYQAFNIARLRLDEKLGKTDDPGSLAIVLDIDEIVLDNSPYEAKAIIDNICYPEGWDAWMNLANANALPDAVDFLNYADQHGVGIFYITNRKEVYREQAIKNLIAEGFPQLINDHLLLRTDGSGKEIRRNLVSENYEIFILLGDELGDFNMIFDKKGTDKRSAGVENLRHEFGKKFCILPTPCIAIGCMLCMITTMVWIINRKML